jgi:hypothetical protein
VHLGDGLPRVVGQTADAVCDVKFMLSYHCGAAFAQQLIVVQQRAGNGILYGSHGNHCGILTQLLVDLFEGLAADELQLLALKILVGGNVVKRPYLALYGHSLHLLGVFIVLFNKQGAKICIFPELGKKSTRNVFCRLFFSPSSSRASTIHTTHGIAS